MNERPRWPWLGFAAGVLLVVTALGYVSVQALRLERLELRARTAAAVEESARAALWRMDSALAPIIARESARPYFHYNPFYPAHRAYTSMWEEVRPGEVLVASPLLSVDDALVRLYFQRSGGGGKGTRASLLTSPQAPTGNMRDLAESAYASIASVIEAERRLEELRGVLAADQRALASVPAAGTGGAGVRAAAGGTPMGGAPQQSASVQQQAQSDYAARQTLNLISRGPAQQVWEAPAAGEAGAAPQQKAAAGAAPPGYSTVTETRGVVQGDMVAVWSAAPGEGGGGEPVLLLARSVHAADAELIQGVWLDWGALRAWLLEQASDVLPGAGLTPALDGDVGAAQSPGRRLAAIPAVLELPAVSGGAEAAWTPMRTTLALSWAAVLAAVAAAGVALRSAAELAERRGRFVSAVTHELRTPLTTFCLYTQMLDEGMVRDESARREYMGTLRRESQRLARIVENVLEFARLGRRSGAVARAPSAVGELLERVTPVLARRGGECGLVLEVDAPAGVVAGARIAADAHAVEQVLVNLVENACKYAAAGGRVGLVVRRESGGSGVGRLLLTVTDQGRGIDPADQRRLFRPFQRGSSLAHASTPGLGLGLAVSRGLARQVGGELTLDRSTAEGTAFTLAVPLAAAE